ncbi:MAG: SDR family NAD(P)-dependent oxidoreductase [Chloroflexi bacterium]|nr:MAG: SDR family NAD(P)-dependent oxidoreductase [Chloroflexota bacterium]MBL1195987.1 SDR family oxidoreductase [Chloroflexota bacterium]NOH13281.1 SDR family oxidoreductase [Chloroflexota bacterium]
MDLKLKDARALVTGASRGLGYATAKALAQEGAQLVINSSNANSITEAAEKLNNDTGAKVTAIAGDLTDGDAPAKTIAEAVESLGGLDILITNAGGPPAGSFESFDEATWDKAIDLSFMSHVRLIRSALPHLRKSEIASVLTVTSYSVKQPVPNLVLSNSIRAATIGLTKTLALELGSDNIRFNSILPAWTETERIYELMGHRAKQSGKSVEEEIKAQSAASPLGRMGTPQEFANAAVFLVSPVASYITGVMLPIDGGMYKGTF